MSLCITDVVHRIYSFVNDQPPFGVPSFLNFRLINKSWNHAFLTHLPSIQQTHILRSLSIIALRSGSAEKQSLHTHIQTLRADCEKELNNNCIHIETCLQSLKRDLSTARPQLETALNSINKLRYVDLQEMREWEAHPPAVFATVAIAVLHILEVQNPTQYDTFRDMLGYASFTTKLLSVQWDALNQDCMAKASEVLVGVDIVSVRMIPAVGALSLFQYCTSLINYNAIRQLAKPQEELYAHLLEERTNAEKTMKQLIEITELF
eukprot:PhF_6_TR15619/c0_g1_i1/m.24231